MFKRRSMSFNSTNTMEELNRLCMKVTQSLGDRPGGTVGILSCNEGDGCSTVSYNLGLTLARKSDGRVLLVDANLRKPCMHRIFKTRMAPGLSDLITGGVGVSEVIRDTDVGNLKVLTAGSHLNNPGLAFESEEMVRLLDEVRKDFEFAIFDFAPLIPYSEMLHVCSKTDMVLLVVQAGKTRWEVAQEGMRKLSDVGIEVFGVVLNKKRYYIPSFLYKRL